MSKSASNQVIRLLPFFVGGLGGTLLFINRILTAQVTGSQSRSDALGVIEAAILILVGLLWQQIQAKTPETVDLICAASESSESNSKPVSPIKSTVS
ncbi:MAG: cofactor assembly of complex C subunit B, partial [Cyanobacteria bacterium J06598_4]